MTPKFKVGTRVRYVRGVNGYFGKLGTITGILPDYVNVRLDGERLDHTWFAWRLEALPTTPFEQMVADYISAELS